MPTALCPHAKSARGDALGRLFKFYVQEAVRLGATQAELGEFFAVASTMGGCVGEMWALNPHSPDEASFHFDSGAIQL